MNIVLEGPDATGKSTLAQYLSDRLRMPIVESKGPPRYSGEIVERAERFLAMDHVILHRHPIISQRIYGLIRPADHSNYITAELMQRLIDSKPVFIFCLPQKEMPHVVKDYDSARHLAAIKANKDALEAMYNHYALRMANILYRIGDDKDRVLRMCQLFDPVADVEDFHRKFGIDYQGKPRALDFDLQQFRLKFIREETTEYEKHGDSLLFELDLLTRNPETVLGLDHLTYDPNRVSKELAAELDALTDLVYVALGTSHLHGFDFRRAWQRVHLANMAKHRGLEDNSAESRFKLKMIKPLGWQAPDHTDTVSDNAHKDATHRP
jgi:predicted HAD superfamily Cof-like phosphohydrolase